MGIKTLWPAFCVIASCRLLSDLSRIELNSYLHLNMTETHLRTIVRTISYRVTALLITAIWTGLNDAVAIHVILTLVQYIFERLWLKIKWGKT